MFGVDKMPGNEIVIVALLLAYLFAMLIMRPRRTFCVNCGLYQIMSLENQILRGCLQQHVRQNHVELPLNGYDKYDEAMNQSTAEPKVYYLEMEG
jgi:hypothetical protein